MPYLIFGISFLVALSSTAAELQPAAVAAFDAYLRQSEARMDAELGSGPFLFIDDLPQPERAAELDQLKKGTVLVRRAGGKSEKHAPGALIHDWLGLAYIPGAKLADLLRLLQDYDHHQNVYKPEVLRSKLISRRGDDFRIFLRLRKHKVITVILDTEYDVRYRWLNATHAYSRSYSTRIAEIENAGTSEEHEKPPAGFLWRLNTYWRFVERDGGVYVQCQAISLTRNVPTGLGWIVGPFVESIPRESLEFTLATTRRALLSKKSSGLKSGEGG